ncbi:diguanylate cyclase domain-containing protein [Methylobacterium durans]|uniref:diguanylate cyclase domain-containing protein n=1 Tax=Methylobacterium durans TaxID=2202825 RepID=UPI003AAE2B83
MERRSSRYVALDGLDAAGREKLLAELDAVLACRVRDISLTGRLREIYRAASWRHRSRTIRFWLLWVSVFSAVTCLIDYVMHPPLLGVSLALRSVFIPVFYAVLAWIWVRPRASWIEGVTLPLTVAAMMLVAELLGSAGGGALHERYLMGGLFATSTAIVVFPIERVWSIAGTVVVIGLFLMFGLMNPNVDAKVPILETTFFTFVIGCLVPARQAMNTVLAHAYLLSLRKRILTEALAAANARLAVLADTDGLTGLPNRRAFQGRLARDWAEQAARSGTIGAILIDVDHFKRFNDSAGHAAGDRCLVAVAAAIRATMPDGALAARYGGEEFVAVVPGTRPRDDRQADPLRRRRPRAAPSGLLRRPLRDGERRNRARTRRGRCIRGGGAPAVRRCSPLRGQGSGTRQRGRRLGHEGRARRDGRRPRRLRRQPGPSRVRARAKPVPTDEGRLPERAQVL